MDAGHPAQTLLNTLEKTLGKLRPHGETELKPNEAEKPKRVRKIKAGPVEASEKEPRAASKRVAAAKAPRKTRTPRAKRAVPDIAPGAGEAPAV